MKISAVISEFNPFHNGHKHLIEQIKADSQNAVAAIMSGSLTQRGEVAVADKFIRAKAAVQNGVDLVVELPSVYACASAEKFARGGVEIARALGITEKLCFGAEDGDSAALKKAAKAFADKAFNNSVKELMNSGEYYPRAVAKAFEKLFPELSEAVSKPNNILAVEYIKALGQSGVEPFAVQRIGAGHDEMTPDGGIASASYIRDKILCGESYSKFVPDYVIDNPADTRNIERVLLFCIRNMSIEQLKALHDVSEGLENRIYEVARQASSLGELCDLIKTKRYTMARIKRILCAALVGIENRMSAEKPRYIRVLAFNKKGTEALGEIKRLSPLPLITNVADGYKALDEKAKRIFDIDIRAADLLALAKNAPEKAGADFTKGVIVSG